MDTLVFEVDRNGDYDFFVWDRCGNLLKYTVPVSYTHLDVYKRQSMRRSEQGWRRAILTRGPMSWMRTAYAMRCAVNRVNEYMEDIWNTIESAANQKIQAQKDRKQPER